jgi:hypothetical protein
MSLSESSTLGLELIVADLTYRMIFIDIYENNKEL